MTGRTYLQAYGLDSLLTGQDDAALWEAALRKHWLDPEDPACMVDALRFSTGRRLLDGEQPQGEENELHAKMRGMVDIETWCFERVGPAQFQVKTCPAQVAPASPLLPGLGLMAILSGQAPPMPAAQVVFDYLGISRPSREDVQVVVYAAFSAPGVGEGAAYLWQRKASGEWEPSEPCLTRWIA